MAQNPIQTDPRHMVEQIKTLTDIESDLAETAIGVAALDETPADLQPVDASVLTQNGDATPVASHPTANANAGGTQETLKVAQALETVLEGTIPPAPALDAAVTDTTKPEGSDADVTSKLDSNEDPVQTPADVQPNTSPDTLTITLIQPTTTITSENAASETEQEVDAAVDDQNVPILPPNVALNSNAAPPDLASSTQSDVQLADSALLGSDAQAHMIGSAATYPTLQTTVSGPPAIDRFNDAKPAASTSDAQAFVASQYGGIAPPIAEVSQLPEQTPYQHLKPPKIDIPLPGNLTASSPSVAGNPLLISRYQSGESIPTLSLDNSLTAGKIRKVPGHYWSFSHHQFRRPTLQTLGRGIKLCQRSNLLLSVGLTFCSSDVTD